MTDAPPWECPRCHCLFERPGFDHEPCGASAALAAIRDDIGARDDLITRMQPGRSYPVAEFNGAQDRLAERVPSLLAAVERVLELHRPADRGTGAQCKGCATHVTFTPWPCTTVRAITAALTGKEAGDE